MYLRLGVELQEPQDYRQQQQVLPSEMDGDSISRYVQVDPICKAAPTNQK